MKNQNDQKQSVVAIDGLSYVGKSTIARELANLTGYTYVNTGHMYRAVARLALKRNILPEDREKLVQLTQSADIRFQSTNGILRTMVNGEDWTHAVDEEQTIQFAPTIAAIPEVRNILTERQREYAQKDVIIMEGRDIGTIVFPHAQWKFFVSASFEVRAKRMYKRLPQEEKKKISIRDENFLQRLRALDHSDLSRTVAPLKKAEDAIEYDNSESPDEIEDAWILYYVMNMPKEFGKLIIYSRELVNKAREFKGKEGKIISGKH